MESVVLFSARPALFVAIFPVVAGFQTSEADVARPGDVFPLGNGDYLKLAALRDVIASYFRNRRMCLK